MTAALESRPTVSLVKHYPLAALQVRAYPLGDVLLLNRIAAQSAASGYATDGEVWQCMMVDGGTLTSIRLVDTSPVRADVNATEVLATGLHAVNVRARENARRATVNAGALTDFRAEVRELAIDAHKNGDFCQDGMNAAFRTLGLTEYVPTFDVSIVVRISATVTAESESEAENMLMGAIIVDEGEGVEDSDVSAY